MNNKARMQLTHDGQVARITLTAPKANILDRAMMLDLEAILKDLSTSNGIKAIVLDSEGPHFSFGASVEEHLPEHISATLEQLRGLLIQFAEAPAPVIAAVRGQCLGGAFELVLACDLVIAEESAQMGLPEIKLGVFPPAGATLLPVRLGLGRAAELALTGASWTAAQAAASGLVQRVVPAGELEAQVEKWLAADFLPRSAAALRCAAQALRRPLVRALKDDLPAIEQLYLSDLMSQPDATEGIQAFLEKRQPQWKAAG